MNSGKARSLIFANHLVEQDPRFSKQDRQSLSFSDGATNLIGQGLQAALLQLAIKGDVKNLALQHFATLSDIATQNYSTFGKIRAYVDTKVPPHLLVNSGNRVQAKALSNARSEVGRKYQHTREYQQISN